MSKFNAELRSSFCLTLFVTLNHGGALVLLWGFGLLPAWASCIGSLLCLVSFWHALGRHALRFSSNAIVSLCAGSSEGEWYLLDRLGRSLPMTWKGGSVVTPMLAVLQYQRKDRLFSILPSAVVVCADAIDKETFRRLRVQLRTSQR